MFQSSSPNTNPSKLRAPMRRESNYKGKYAVNAVTGDQYPYHIGGYDTLRLFRVRDSSSRYSNGGKYIKSNDRTVEHARESRYLYYDGPKEYMDHTGNVVAQSVIERWKTLQQNLLDDKGNVKPSAYNEYLKTKNLI